MQIPKAGGSAQEEQGAESGTSDYLIASAQGATFTDALAALEITVPRDLTLTQVKLLVVSEALARHEKFFNFAESLAKLDQSCASAYFAVCRGDAGDLCANSGRSSACASRWDTRHVRSSQDARYITGATFADFYYQGVSVFSDPVAILCATAPEAPAERREHGALDDLTPENVPATSENENEYVGAALFRDGLMVGYLDGLETCLLNAIYGASVFFSYSFEGMPVSLRSRGVSGLKIESGEDGRLRIAFKLRFNAIADLKTPPLEEIRNTLRKTLSSCLPVSGAGRGAVRLRRAGGAGRRFPRGLGEIRLAGVLCKRGICRGGRDRPHRHLTGGGCIRYNIDECSTKAARRLTDEKRHEGELWRAMYALIINPISGNGRGRQEQPRVEALLRRESLPYRTFVAESAAEARTYARQAVEEKMTGVIAVGGDGTLFQIINGLAGSELTLLFACCGTGNDFARTLRLPKDPVEALQAQLHAPLSRIDIGRMNDTYFLNVSGTGFDVEVLRQAEKYKQAHKGLGVYLRGVRDAIRAFRPLDARLGFDGAEMENCRFTIISIGNGRYIGGGMRAVPTAQVNDGLFDVVITPPHPALEHRHTDGALRAGLVRPHAPLREGGAARACASFARA